MSQSLADKNSDWGVSIQEAFNYAYEKCADPSIAITLTHPQMIDQYDGDCCLNSSIHASWFTNLVTVMTVLVLGYAIRIKKKRY